MDGSFTLFILSITTYNINTNDDQKKKKKDTKENLQKLNLHLFHQV